MRTRLAAGCLPVLLLILAGCQAPVAPAPSTTSPTAPRFGHEHSVFRMFADGEEVNFTDPAFDYSSTGYTRAHLHLSGGESTHAQFVIHEEGELGATLAMFFDSLGVDLKAHRVVLDTTVHGGRTVASNATHSWQLWVDHCSDGDGPWARAEAFEGYAPRHHDRMVLSFSSRRANATSLGPEMGHVPTEAQLLADLKDRC